MTTTTTTTTTQTDASRAYASAYNCHYVERDLLGALSRYRALITQHPNTDESTNARAQIENIVKSVIPLNKLMDAQIELARSLLLHTL